jgi:hypothetical protein
MRRVAFDENKLAAGRISVEVGGGDVHVDVEVHSGSEMDSQGYRSHCALAELAVLNFAMVAQRKGHCKSGWRDAGWQYDP